MPLKLGKNAEASFQYIISLKSERPSADPRNEHHVSYGPLTEMLEFANGKLERFSDGMYRLYILADDIRWGDNHPFYRLVSNAAERAELDFNRTIISSGGQVLSGNDAVKENKLPGYEWLYALTISSKELPEALPKLISACKALHREELAELSQQKPWTQRATKTGEGQGLVGSAGSGRPKTGLTEE